MLTNGAPELRPLVSQSERILVTGASGWLAREVLELLLRHNGREWLENNVVCLSSSSDSVELSDGLTLNPKDFWKWVPDGPINGFVPLAFLTKEKYSRDNRADYIADNLSITARHSELAGLISPSWVSIVSSGAVYRRGTSELPVRLEVDPYGYLKWLEEASIRQLSSQLGFNFSIGRLWAGLGSYMKPNRAYAIVDFVFQVRQSGLIRVNSEGQVYRQICDVTSFLQELFHSAQDGFNNCFDSAGERVEIGDLARLVANHMVGNPDVIIRSLSPQTPPDNYYPPEGRGESPSLRSRVPGRSLDQLVVDTCQNLLHFDDI